MFPGRRPDTRRSGIDAVWYLVRSESNLEDVRLHDLRHAFAVRALESTLSAERRDVARHMLTLSTYLGHSNTADTYWYLEATPVLLRQVSPR